MGWGHEVVITLDVEAILETELRPLLNKGATGPITPAVLGKIVLGCAGACPLAFPNPHTP